MTAFDRGAQDQTIIALLNAGNPAGAETRARQMLQQDPNDSYMLALLSVCRLQLQDKKAALEIARAAAKIDPESWMVRRALLDALIANRRQKEARPLAERLASETPDDSDVMMLAAMTKLSTGTYEGVHDLYERAEANAGEDVLALINMAFVRLDQWRYDHAEALATRAMRLDPGRAEIFYILGECALAKGLIDKANGLGLEALRLNPLDKKTMRLLGRAHVRKDPLMKPFLHGVDWVMETDKAGFLLLPLLFIPAFAVLGVSIFHDINQALVGRPPVIIFSLAALGLIVYFGVSYFTALSTRWRIRQDMKRFKLQNF